MSKALGMRCVWGLCGVLASVLALAPATRAEVSTDVSGSVLVFPRVVWTGFNGGPSQDTIIQITNTSNMEVFAHCFYVNARLVQGRPLWQVTDFSLTLTKKQPTHWVVSQGRRVSPLDSCFDSGKTKSIYSNNCDGAGIDPGAIPPVSEGFTGELKCVEVDPTSGNPMPSNSLKGEAVIRADDGDVSKYNALAISANLDNPPDSLDQTLTLDNTATHDGEYNSCPNVLLLNHLPDVTAEENGDLGLDNQSADFCDGLGEPDLCGLRTYLTLVPCSQDFENLIPSQVTVDFLVTNDFEETTSSSTTVDCWLRTRLADLDVRQGNCTGDGSPCTSDDQCLKEGLGLCDKFRSIFAPGTRGSMAFYTTITPADNAARDIFEGGVVGIAEEGWFAGYQNGTGGGLPDGDEVMSTFAAWNLQQQGTRYDALRDSFGEDVANENADQITIPSRF